MDMNNVYTTLCLCLLFWLGGCSEQGVLTDDVPEDSPAGGFCFRVPESDRTRITYDGVFSDFQENDTLGCLIYTRSKGSTDGFAYAANAKWHYYNAVLVLDKVFKYEGAWLSEPVEVTGLISRLNTGSQDGYLQIEDASKEKEFAFYFYYPYTDRANLTVDVSAALAAYNADSSQEFYRMLQFPNWASNVSLSYTNQYGGSTTLAEANIKEYAQRFTGCALPGSDYVNEWRMAATALPCFVNHTQQNMSQLNNSDFLWVKCEKDYEQNPITQESRHPIPLEFEKKTATVEIIADTELTDVCFRNENIGIVMGAEIDLLTGVLTPYDQLTGVNDSEVKRKLLKENHRNTRPLLPYAYEGNRKFRMTFVPQIGFDCLISFTINGGEHLIDLGERIMELKEGHLYTIRINQMGDYSITIEDWEFGNIEFIDPAEGVTPSNP